MTTTFPTIAIVDDDESVRCALGHLLRAAQFDSLTFASAEEFLTSSDAEQVDWLIADVNLPGMSGVALVQELRAAGRDLPTIFISARDDLATLGRDGCGPFPYLRKPFSDKALFAAISQLLKA